MTTDRYQEAMDYLLGSVAAEEADLDLDCEEGGELSKIIRENHTQQRITRLRELGFEAPEFPDLVRRRDDEEQAVEVEALLDAP